MEDGERRGIQTAAGESDELSMDRYERAGVCIHRSVLPRDLDRSDFVLRCVLVAFF